MKKKRREIESGEKEETNITSVLPPSSYRNQPGVMMMSKCICTTVTWRICNTPTVYNIHSSSTDSKVVEHISFYIDRLHPEFCVIVEDT